MGNAATKERVKKPAIRPQSGQATAKPKLAALAARLRDANYHDWWNATYRTEKPETDVQACLWAYKEMKDLMLEAAALISIEDAGRRGLILANPGLRGKPYMTDTLFGDVQILSPGEKAPAHRHTTSACRFFLEGEGAYTNVEGEKCTMGPGDLIINPAWAWHDHGHEGSGTVIYLNMLDVPLVSSLGCVFYDSDYWKENDASKTIQTVKRINASNDYFATGGVLPKNQKRKRQLFSSQLTYRYADVMAALERMTQYEPDPYDGYCVEYCNPETGGQVLPTMSFTMQMLSPGKTTLPHRHTSSSVYCCVSGKGSTVIEGTTLNWSKNDIFVVPSWKWHEHRNQGRERAVLFAVSDTVAIQTLGLYREEGKTARGDVVRVVHP
jgi:gentisate 1,2-dioxygenase